MQRQVRHLNKKVEREQVLLAKLPNLSVQILDHIRAQGRITVGDAVTVTGVSRNTLKPHFRTLQTRGLLVLRGQGKGDWYSLA